MRTFRNGSGRWWSAFGRLGLFVLMMLAFSGRIGAVEVGVDPSASWSGFMNVSDLPQNGGVYQFGSGWGTPDLRATFDGPVLTLAPNTIGDPAAYWYTPGGGPDAVGNKIMNANFFVETTGVYTGQTLTFTGVVLSNTLQGQMDPNGNGWTTFAFIKDFSADYSGLVVTTVPLTAGVFSLSLNLIDDPARHVQFGFEVTGPNVWATDPDLPSYGNVQVTAVPEPGLIGAGGLLGVALMRRRRR